MQTQTLTTLINSDDRSGTLAIYIYVRGSERHHAPVYFSRSPNYSEGEKPVFAVKAAVDRALSEGREVRITNSSDFLVFHAKGETVLYPPDPAEFWQSLGLSVEL